MDKRKSIRGIVYKEDSIFLIRRVKNDEEYFVFPGGGIEEGETDDVALERELVEEIGVVARKIKPLYILEDEKAIQKFVLCEYISGEFKDATGPEWTSEEYKSHGIYEQLLVKIDELEKYNIVPHKIAKKFFDDLKKYKTLKSI